MYTNIDWLRQHIEQKGMTVAEAASLIGVPSHRVAYHAKKNGIHRPNSTKKPENINNAKKLHDKEWLQREYIELNKSYEIISKENNVGKTTVARWVKRHGLDKLKDTRFSGKRVNEGPPVKVSCAQCNGEVTLKFCRYLEGGERFCSRVCAARWRVENTDAIENLQEAATEWRDTEEGKVFMRKHGAYMASVAGSEETSIERKIRELLTSSGIVFETQKKMYYWCVDFYIPKYDIIIEAQGDYWHAHPDKYPNPNEMQRKNIRRDKGKEAYMKKCGHTFLAFWESDINEDIEGILFQILAEINAKEAIA